MLEAIADEMLMRVVATQAAVYKAREQLERVSHLEWESPAGRAFRDRAMELAGKIAELDHRLEAARIQIWSARADLAELEVRILSGISVPGSGMLTGTLPPELDGVINVRGRS
ncbi:hypothetical protein CQ018_06455 [Arthrobacter sp. MYb227]|uniref:hypothetical protein n=1 Tax=Arthrobacter sp. MYb227 TaxID=1848601 RepID=UPI000CFC32FA|nr:hypothetical protein [Arthrobacter sp. MYb227]PQZ94974.1 hypothetical protein CQ018_06455 [Arthrobacter sp. MYb227]